MTRTFWSHMAGAVVGAIVAFALLIIWLRAATLGNEFWAAIGGAVVGGAITAIMQLLELRAAAKQRQEDRTDVRNAQGRALLFKMMRIYSNLRQLHNYIEESVQEAAKRGYKGEIWTILRPLANLPDKMFFSADEMSLILSIKDLGLFNSLLSMDVVHNSTIDLFGTVSELGHGLRASLPAYMSGDVGSIALTEEQQMKFRPRMVELNLLIEAVRERSKKDAVEAFEVLEKLQSVLNARLGFGVQLDAPMPTTPANPASGPARSGRRSSGAGAPPPIRCP